MSVASQIRPCAAGSTPPEDQAVRPSELGVPLSPLEADMKALVARRIKAGVAAEARHLMDPAEKDADAAFARLAVEHPDTCAGAADYPGWTAGGTA